ncbi:MAG: TRAP transporter substrate-binding protein [Deltaproteobacteria bacterium]|nr:TRAP transporter substrate-binding protein [Deltaproteobacteria bacterium]
MRQKFLVVFLCLSVMSLGLAAAAGAAEQPKPITLKVPSAFPTKLPMLGIINYFKDAVEKSSGGNITVKIYEPGKLVPPFEIHDAVSSGQVNAGYTASMYLQGKIPAASFFTSVPFGPSVTEYLAWFYEGDGLKLYQEMYDKYGYNVKVLPLVFMSPESGGWFRAEIKNLDDLKGLRLRWPGLGGTVLAKLGASVSAIPGSEIFPALEKGAIDGTEFSQPAIDAKLGFWKVAKYNYFPAWHQTSTQLELIINKDTWNSMSDSQRALIETAVAAAHARCIAQSEGLEGKVLKENAEKNGVHNMLWPPEVLAKLQETWNQVASEEAAKDEFFKKVWTNLNAFMDEYQVWECKSIMAVPQPKCD